MRALAAFLAIFTSGWQQLCFDATEAYIKIVATFARVSIVKDFIKTLANWLLLFVALNMNLRFWLVQP